MERIVLFNTCVFPFSCHSVKHIMYEISRPRRGLPKTPLFTPFEGKPVVTYHLGKNTYMSVDNCGSAGSAGLFFFFFLLTGLGFICVWQRGAPGQKPCQKLGRPHGARWQARTHQQCYPTSRGASCLPRGWWPSGHTRLVGSQRCCQEWNGVPFQCSIVDVLAFLQENKNLLFLHLNLAGITACSVSDARCSPSHGEGS